MAAPALDISPIGRARRAGRLASGALLCVAGAVAVLALLPAAFGLQRYVIVSGSMSGTYDRGSLVFDEVVPVGALRVGDVITYRPPAEAGVDHPITHRIAEIVHDRTGSTVYRTRGDANPAADPWTFTLPGSRQARVKAGVPYAGFALAALSRKDVRVGLIALPAALIALASLVATWRRLGEEAQRRAQAGAA
jgi:signal peptidase